MTQAVPTIDPARSALLIMDYQAGILDRMPSAGELLGLAATTIGWFRERGGQIGYVRVAFDDKDFEDVPATSRMGQRILAGGRTYHTDSPATAIPGAIAPQDGDIVVRKIRVGAFSTTDLDQQLRGRGIDTLILAGISTSGVVLSTVRDGHDRDYQLFVLSDLTADPDPATHEFLMTTVLPRQADIITTADLGQLVS